MKPDATELKMRQDASDIFQAGLDAADPMKAILKRCCIDGTALKMDSICFDLEQIERILVVGAGKATAVMAKAVEQILGNRISDGVISIKYGHGCPLEHVRIIEAGHPLPDSNGMQASKQILDLVLTAGRNDLVICLISGGGSALLPLPAEGLTLENKQEITGQLLACGATIHEINALRKHLSAIKGGRLAKAAAPAAVVSLILSDVVGDDLDVIASGPCVPDNTTYRDCYRIFEKYDLLKKVPQAVLSRIEKGSGGTLDETPKPGASFFEKTCNLIVGSNRMALQACFEKAVSLVYNPLILSSFIEGETHSMAKIHAGVAKEILATDHPAALPACILSGGETTLQIKGSGKGGRNQEAALVAAMHISGLSKVVVLFAGTDGTDGPTDAAGAFADGKTLLRAGENGMDPWEYLNRNDAYHFFKALDDLLITGPTGTNVMDLNIVLTRPPR